MSYFVVEGGRRLVGEVDVAGSKNISLALMSAVVMAPGVTVLHNIPDLSDTRTKAKLLETFGVKVNWLDGSLYLDCTDVTAGDADEEIVRKIRTSFYLLGPLMARVGKITLPAPGGCKIGARPVDFHLRGFELMGAKVEQDGDRYHADGRNLTGAEIYFDFPSAGATQHLMTTAVLAKGNTVIQNAAMEPEVTVLAAFLNAMGAKIEGAGTSMITIQGREAIEPCEFRVPADRLQASTYLLAGAITHGDVRVNGVDPETQTALVNKLREAGADADEGHDWVQVSARNRLKAIRVKTMPYPGFPTDIQQPTAAMLTLAEGTSTVEETIYESRIGHVEELKRMGAKINLEGRSAIIHGVKGLKGANVEASDLRAGAALVLAGLAAEGETTIRKIEYIDRGYQAFEQNLRKLGGKIERVGTLIAETPLL
jgi:UDP-N-acetylglucosamine 1-carboxyvinyltransferase